MNHTIDGLLAKLRARATERHAELSAKLGPKPSFGDRVSDRVTAAVGSWPFILIQSGLLAAWIVFNLVDRDRVDPYPFILLNLLLSFQAAYTAPIIMMSQNRAADSDRKRAIEDFEVNCKAEIEIEALHQKIDLLREQEISALTAAVERLTRQLEAKQG